MSQGNDYSHELHKLMAALREDQLTEATAQRLAELVQNDPSARKLYIEHITTYASLRWYLSGSKENPELELPESELLVSTENILALLEEDAEIAQREAAEQARIESLAAEKFSAFRRQQESRTEPVAVPRNVFYATVSTLAAAAIIGILLLVGWGEEPAHVAKIVGTNGLVWANDGAAMPSETSLRAGQLLDLKAGLLELEFGDGARVILEGPAQFTIQSPGKGDLQLGKLVAYVPGEAHGFLIQTPGMEIVDLGTEFGVVVDVENKSQVRVFAGLVNLQAENNAKHEVESLLLRPGTTIEVVSPSAASAQVDANGSVFKQVSVIPKLSRTLLAKNQEGFTDDFSEVSPGRYSMRDTYRQGGAFDFEQGSLNMRPAIDNTMAVMLTEPGLRLRSGDQFTADLSVNQSKQRRVGLLISTLVGQPDGAESFGFRFCFADGKIWVHAYAEPSDNRPGLNRGPEIVTLDLPKGPLTLSVERVNNATFKFYCQSTGSPNRLLVDTRSINALENISELYVGIQCFRKQDPLVVHCNRLTVSHFQQQTLQE